MPQLQVGGPLKGALITDFCASRELIPTYLVVSRSECHILLSQPGDQIGCNRLFHLRPSGVHTFGVIWVMLSFLCCSRIMIPTLYFLKNKTNKRKNLSSISGQMPCIDFTFWLCFELESSNLQCEYCSCSIFHSFKSWSSGFNHPHICLQRGWAHFRVWLSLLTHRHWPRVIFFVKSEFSWRDESQALVDSWRCMTLGLEGSTRKQTRLPYSYFQFHFVAWLFKIQIWRDEWRSLEF